MQKEHCLLWQGTSELVLTCIQPVLCSASDCNVNMGLFFCAVYQEAQFVRVISPLPVITAD